MEKLLNDISLIESVIEKFNKNRESIKDTCLSKVGYREVGSASSLP